jgi:NADPH2:quinone reductase
MRAVWYERPGRAADVLQVGEMPDPTPGAGEVRVRLSRPGINPGDTKKRADWVGYGMPYPRVIPHSDGAGVIDAVGAGVDRGRSGRRVWVFCALAAQLAVWGGAHVIATVRRQGDLSRVTVPGAPVVALDDADPAAAIRAHAPEGVDRIVEVSFSDNVDLDAAVARNGAVITAYATRADRPDFPFWPMLFSNVTIRLIGSDDFPAGARQQAATDLTTAARDGALSVRIGAPLPLERAAEAHDRVDAGTRERVLLAIPE